VHVDADVAQQSHRVGARIGEELVAEARGEEGDSGRLR
jgi:hypothetical protein